MLAEIDRRYDALILDARLRRNGAEEYWKKEKEKWKVEILKGWKVERLKKYYENNNCNRYIIS